MSKRKAHPVQNKSIKNDTIQIDMSQVKVRKNFAPKEQVVQSTKHPCRAKQKEETRKESLCTTV